MNSPVFISLIPVILFIAMLDEFVHVVLRGQPPRYEKAPPQSDEEIVERAMASGV